MPTFGTTVDDEVVSLHEQYYIQATSSRADDRTRVLKHGETFAVFDRFGDVQPVGLGEQGLYHDGTRFLSRLELRLGGRRPLLLSLDGQEGQRPADRRPHQPRPRSDDGQLVLPRGSLHVFRTKFLWRGCCYERLRVSNFGDGRRSTSSWRCSFDADFADIFEVRGTKRERRGRRYEPRASTAAACMLGYEGLDASVRRDAARRSTRARRADGGQARFQLRLPPQRARRRSD